MAQQTILECEVMKEMRTHTHTHTHAQKEIRKLLANRRGIAEGARLYTIKKPVKYTFKLTFV
jgi:hypothetical protein